MMSRLNLRGAGKRPSPFLRREMLRQVAAACLLTALALLAAFGALAPDTGDEIAGEEAIEARDAMLMPTAAHRFDNRSHQKRSQ